MRPLRSLALAPFAALVALCLAAGTAHADLAPNPGPCDHQAVGSACVQPDGTAGVCASRTDSRRNRTYTTCERDEHECDRLAVGAACHGYLHHPAHCREFTDDRTHAHWRACTVDPGVYRSEGARVPSASLARACSVGRTAGAGGAGGAVGCVAVGVLAMVAARRRRRAGK